MAEENGNKLYFVEDKDGEWAMLVAAPTHEEAVLAWAPMHEYEGYARAFEVPAVPAGEARELEWGSPRYFSVCDVDDPGRFRVEEEGDLLKLFEK